MQATQQKNSHLYKECTVCHELLYASTSFYKKARRNGRTFYTTACKPCTIKRNVLSKQLQRGVLKDVESHITDPHRDAFWEARDLKMAWACSCEYCTDMSLYLITKGFDRGA